MRVRNHNPKTLKQLSRAIKDRFVDTGGLWSDPRGEARGRPGIAVQIEQEFPAMRLADDAPLLCRIDQAAGLVQMPLAHTASGGGSDANIFNGKGLATAVVATGMTNVHATDEQLSLADLQALTRLVLALLTEVPF